MILHNQAPAPLSRNWERAMLRARRDGLKATRHADGTFTVPSSSHPGSRHHVDLEPNGHIVRCTCRGWERFGRTNPCKHAGAVALALCAIRGIRLEQPQMPVQSLRLGKSQLFAPEAL